MRINKAFALLASMLFVLLLPNLALANLPPVPVAVAPVQDEIAKDDNVIFKVGINDPEGMPIKAFQLQVATDPQFTSVLIDSTRDFNYLNSRSYTIPTSQKWYVSTRRLADNTGGNPHYWRMKVQDTDPSGAAGVWSDWSAAIPFYVDNSTPETSIIAPTSNQVIDPRGYRFSWSYWDPKGSPQAQVRVRISDAVSMSTTYGERIIQTSNPYWNNEIDIPGTCSKAAIAVKVTNESGYSSIQGLPGFLVMFLPQGPAAIPNTPANGENINGAVGHFEWAFQSVSGGSQTEFKFQLATDAGFANLLHNEDILSANTFYDLTEPVSAPGQYYWRVAVNDGRTPWNPSWSPAQRFYISESLAQSGLGGKSFYEYYTVDTGFPGLEVLVNQFNGNLFLEATDFSIPARGILLAFGRSYNSQSNVISPLGGDKWVGSVSRLIFEASGNITALNSDGSYTAYLLNPDGTFMPPPGEGRKLVENVDGTYSIATKERIVYNYDSSGYLLNVTDRHGNRTSIVYEDFPVGADMWHLPVTISDSSDVVRSLTIAYEPGVTIALRMNSVTDLLGRQVQYDYDTLDRLVAVTDRAGHVIQYDYDTDSNLTGIVDEDGNRLSFEYDSSFRVASVTSAAQNAIVDPTQRFKTTFSYDVTSLKTTRTEEADKIYPVNNRIVELVFYGDGSPKSISKVKPGSGYIDRVTEYQWDQREIQTVTKKGRLDSDGKQTTAYYYTTGTDGLSDLTKKVTDFGTGKLNLTETYSYDQYHNMTSVTDPKGNLTTYDWGADGKTLLQVIRPAVLNPAKPGNPLEPPITTYAYDTYGQKLTETDPEGNQKINTYDGHGNLRTVSIPHSIDPVTGQLVRSVTSFDYDLVGRKTAETDARSNAVGFEYDLDDLVTTVTYADGGRTSYTYSPTHRKLTETVKASATISYTTSYSYDPDGRLIQADYPDGGQTKYAYNAVGHKSEEWVKINPTVERLTWFAYDHDDLLASVRVSEGYDYSYYFYTENDYYDHYGNKTREVKGQTGQTSATTWFQYDGANRLVRVIDPENYATNYTYDENGNKVSETNPLMVTTTFQYDALNRLTTVTKAAGTVDEAVTRYAYYLTGTKFSETDPNNYVTSFDYHPNLLLKRQNSPDGGWAEFEYDLEGNKTVAKVAMAADRVAVTRYAYGPTNLLTEVTDAEDGVTKYEYDLRGKLTALVNAKNNRTTYEYDSMGRLSRTTDAGLNFATYSYDLAGNRTQVIDRKGQTLSYEYDVMNRLTLFRAPALVDTTYTYDFLGNKLTMTDATGTTTYTYYLNSWLKSITDPQTRLTEYEYDGNGNRTFMTNPYDGATKKTAYQYDNVGRLKSVTDPDGKTVTYTYDDGGRKIAETLPGGAQVTYAYDAMNRKTHLTNTNALGQILSEFAYTYDLAGNQLTKVDSKGTTSYAYDDLARLTNVTNQDQTTVQYTYDATSNRRTLIDSAGTTTYEYNNLDRLTSTTGPSGTTTYEYDFSGNQTVVTTGTDIQTFTYDALNRQIGFTGPSGTGSYAYDGEGHRISKTENGATKQYIYDGDFVLLELNGASAYTTRNLLGRNYLGRTTLTGTPEYMSLLLNGHTDVVSLLAADGVTTANSYYYDAWGNFTEKVETAHNDLYYALQEFDPLTGNYHMGAREYAPGLGRFTTADSWTELPDDERGYRVGDYGLRLNLYTYALDNPLIYVDPLGHDVGFAGRDGSSYSENEAADRYADVRKSAGDKRERSEIVAETKKAQKAPQKQIEVFTGNKVYDSVATSLLRASRALDRFGKKQIPEGYVYLTSGGLVFVSGVLDMAPVLLPGPGNSPNFNAYNPRNRVNFGMGQVKVALGATGMAVGAAKVTGGKVAKGTADVIDFVGSHLRDNWR